MEDESSVSDSAYWREEYLALCEMAEELRRQGNIDPDDADEDDEPTQQLQLGNVNVSVSGSSGELSLNQVQHINQENYNLISMASSGFKALSDALPQLRLKEAVIRLHRLPIYQCAFCERVFHSSDLLLEHKEHSHRKEMDLSVGTISAMSLDILASEALSSDLVEDLKSPEVELPPLEIGTNNREMSGQDMIMNLSETLETYDLLHSSSEVPVMEQDRPVQDVPIPIEEHPCTHCDQVFQTPSSLLAHISAHTNGLSSTLYVQCLLCQQRFLTDEVLRQHQREAHYKEITENTSATHVPVSNILNQTGLIRSSPSNNLENIRCNDSWARVENSSIYSTSTNNSCGGADTNIANLSSNNIPNTSTYSSRKPEEPPRMKIRQCKLCPQKFLSRLELCEHLEQSHNAPGMPVNCKLCELNFPNATAFKEHIIRLKDNTFRCSNIILNEARAEARLLEQQYSRNISTGTELKCDYCPATFSDLIRLCIHRKYYHLLGNKNSTGVAAGIDVPGLAAAAEPEEGARLQESISTSPALGESSEHEPAFQSATQTQTQTTIENSESAAFPTPLTHQSYGQRQRTVLTKSHFMNIVRSFPVEVANSFAIMKQFEKSISSMDQANIVVNSDTSANSIPNSPGGKLQQCFLCPEVFLSQVDMLKHFETNHDTQPYQVECNFCKAVFRNCTDFKQHVLIHETNAHNFLFSNKSSSSPQLSRPEEQLITTNKLKCQFCPAVFYHLSGMETHVEIYHRNPGQLSEANSQRIANNQQRPGPIVHLCPFCSNQFLTRDGLLNHHHKHHAKLCQQTSAEHAPASSFPVSSSSNELRKTSLTSSEQLQFKCELCEMGFPNRPYLTQHVFNYHKDSNVCCGLVFIRGIHLEHHRATAHGHSERTPEVLPGTTTTTGEKTAEHPGSNGQAQTTSNFVTDTESFVPPKESSSTPLSS